MDPTATYNAMWELFTKENYEEAAKHARDLRAWLDNGGLPPPHVTLERCEFVIRYVLATAKLYKE